MGPTASPYPCSFSYVYLSFIMVATLGSRYKALIMVANIETARPEIWEKQQAATIQSFILQITDGPNHWEWQSPVKWAMSRANDGCFTSILCWIHDLMPLPCTYTKNSPVEDMKQFLSQPFLMSSHWRILRGRRLKVVGSRKNGRPRGRQACLPLGRPFFLAPTTSKQARHKAPPVFWRGALRDPPLVAMSVPWRNRELLYSGRPLIDNNDFNQVGVLSGFSEKKGLGGMLILAGS